MARHFVKAVFKTPAAMADEAAGFLVARGALGCAVKEPVKAISRRKVVSLQAYFDHLAPSQLAAIGRAMASAGMLGRDGRQPRTERIIDPGWSTLWMKRFKPLRLGRRFMVVPPWSRERDPKRLTVIIRPARAFGTGHHPTTSGVLRALERLCAARQFRSAMDVGTGSGVLAIAMKLIGVGEVLAIDTDADALSNARENAALNGLEAKLRFSSAALGRFHRRFELVTANILASTLIEIAPELTRLVSRDGRLILAGILAPEADRVLSRYRPALRCLASTRNHGWVTLVLGR
jgi:ribosomal protein L11 methyltransferase